MASFDRIVNGRFWIYRHVVHVDKEPRVVVFDLYDPVSDSWLGSYQSFKLAFAACREATRKTISKGVFKL